MSERFVGNVKWFNATKGTALLDAMAVRMYSCIIPPFKAMDIVNLRPNRRWNFQSKMVTRDYKLQM